MQINPSEQIPSNSVRRDNINTTTSGEAVIRKVIAGTNISVTSTGADAGTGDVTVNAASIFGLNVPWAVSGRLTLQSGVPCMGNSTVTSSTVYFTPFNGNCIPVWNGSAFAPQAFTELSNVLANSSTGKAGPFAAVSGAVYDLYVWSDAGTLRLSRSDMWQQTATVTITNASPAVVTHNSHGLAEGAPVRLSVVGGSLPPNFTAGTTYYVRNATTNTYQLAATAGGTVINAGGAASGTITATEGIGDAQTVAVGTTIARGSANAQNLVTGILTNTNAITNGPGAGVGLYVGSMIINNGSIDVSYSPTTTIANTIGIWNQFNRRPWRSNITNNFTASWTYTTAAWRYADAVITQTKFVIGQDEDGVEAVYNAIAGTTSATAKAGVGLDVATSIPAAGTAGVTASLLSTVVGTFSGYTGIGTHYLIPIEYGGTGVSFQGNNGGSDRQSGMIATGMY